MRRKRAEFADERNKKIEARIHPNPIALIGSR